MQQSCDFGGAPQLNHEEWAALADSMSGGEHEVIDRNVFVGWIRQVSVCGIAAAAFKIQCGLAAVGRDGSTYRFEVNRRAVRLADTDWYWAIFQLAGRSTLTQNDHTVHLAAGDIGFLDGTRTLTRLSDSGSQWFSIYLPRQPLVSHLGFEPQACLHGCGETLAARVLRQLVLDGVEDENPAARSDPYMRLALYDLVGALFAPSEPSVGSRHSDTLFKRIRGIVEDSCTDPDFGPNEVAAETGISLRYLQKLFTDRGSTCCEFIYSLRLEHAARLVKRRSSLRTNQPLSEIAYACGFRDYAHFARKFRCRFGHAPSAHSGELDGAGDRALRAHTGEIAP